MAARSSRDEDRSRRRAAVGITSGDNHVSVTSVPRLLVADDQPDVLEALRLLVKGQGYQADTVESPAAVLKALEQRDYDAVLIDLNYARDTTSGEEGLDLLTKIHSADESMPVVVMTAWGSVNLAVEAMRRGARDFIEKPWDNERLLTIIRTQIELGRALRRASRLEAQSMMTQADGSPLLARDCARRLGFWRTRGRYACEDPWQRLHAGHFPTVTAVALQKA